MDGDPCPRHPGAVQVRGLCSLCSRREHRDERPYQTIARYYRERIESGEMMPGERIPSLAHISEQWGVASATAHKAVQTLQRDGFVYSSTQGSFVYRSKGLDQVEEILRTPAQAPTGCRSTVHCASFGFCERCAPGLARASSHVIEALTELGKGTDSRAYGQVMEILRDMETT